MSVGHICNMVIGGLESICPECFFTFLRHKANHFDILSSLFEIHVYYSVLFHMLYIFNLMMMSTV